MVSTDRAHLSYPGVENDAKQTDDEEGHAPTCTES